MTAEAAGAYRRTDLERTDQRVSWERSDQAFFAAGACHVLAWNCKEVFSDRSVQIVAMCLAGDARAFHVYARYEAWAFDHAGWNSEHDLLDANVRFEGRGIERVEVSGTLAEFCHLHTCRPPGEFWADPTSRARAFIASHRVPWT